MARRFTREQAKQKTYFATNDEVKLVGKYVNSSTKTLFEDEAGRFYSTPHNVWQGTRNPKTQYQRAKKTYYSRFTEEEREKRAKDFQERLFKKYGKITGFKPRKGKTLNCLICKKEFYRKPSSLQKYCSRECTNKGFEIEKEIRKCKTCKKEYSVYKSYLKIRKSLYCSVKCRGLAQRKKNDKFSRGKRSFKKILWRFFSKYIRQRDKGLCISCGKQSTWKDMDAGHYIPKTAGLSIYFDERNVNAQCRRCNRFLHGNLSQYAIALRKKYGDDILEELEKQRQKKVRFDIDDYREMIDYYKSRVKED